MADIEITNIEEVNILSGECTDNQNSTMTPSQNSNNDENTNVPATPVVSLFDKRIVKEKDFLESEAVGFDFKFSDNNMEVETTTNKYKGVKIILQISKLYPLYEP